MIVRRRRLLPVVGLVSLLSLTLAAARTSNTRRRNRHVSSTTDSSIRLRNRLCFLYFHRLRGSSHRIPVAPTDAANIWPIGTSKRKDDQSSSQEGNPEETRSKGADFLLSVGNFVPFSTSTNEPNPSKDPPISNEGGFLKFFSRSNDEANDKKAEKKVKTAKVKSSADQSESNSTFPNFFGFRYKDEIPTEQQSQNKKKAKTTIKREKKNSASKPGDAKESDDFFGLRRAQGFFSFNFTSEEKPESNIKKNSDDSNNSSNPLVAIQKFVTQPWSNANSDPFSKNAGKENWYTVFSKTQIMPGQVVPVTIAGLDLLVIASTDSRTLYCIANSCPHLGTPLETGRLTRLPTEVNVPAPSTATPESDSMMLLSEMDVSNILSQDGCEDCIVCPLHRTAFALSSGEVRGEWCPYPPVLGALMGTVKTKSSVAVFDVRTRGKNIEVRLNSLLNDPANSKQKRQ